MAKLKTFQYFRVLPRWLFVKLTDENGNVGWGEATLEGHTEAVEGALDEMFSRLQDFDADKIELIWQTIYRLGFYRGGPVLQSALSGIDIALWDLKARKLNVPIYELLGGKVRDKLKVYAWIGGDEPKDVEVQAKARQAQGFKAVKMNATEGIDWLDSPSVLRDAVERLKTVKALGMDAGMDFHGRVHKGMARQLIRALTPHEPLFVEEPLLSEHPEGIAQIAQQCSIPIALGERLHSRWDVKPFLQHIDIIQPDISHVGGISEIRRIASMCEAFDIALAPHCPLGPIALAACMQVDAATANFAIQEMSLGIHYNTDGFDLLSYVKDAKDFEVNDGYVLVSSKPGLGFEIDEEAVLKASVNSKAWRSGEFHGPDGFLREW